MAESRVPVWVNPKTSPRSRFLVGEDSRWITGQIIDVDGGHHLRRPDFTAFIEPALGWDVMLARKGLGE
jgi:hypothetical protein